MKIKEAVISKSVKQTRATKNDFGGTDYDSVEPSISYTIENPTDKEIKELRQRVNEEVVQDLSIDPAWMTDDKAAGVQRKEVSKDG